MQVQVLGPVTVLREQNSLVLGGPRQRTVLALLLVNANRVVPADRLIDEVWGESPPAGGRDALYVYVSNLRRLLGPDRLTHLDDGYRLQIEPGELDAADFEDEVAQARTLLVSDPKGAVEILEGALGRWQGDPYQGIDLPSVSTEATRLTELRLAAVEDHLEARLGLGQHHQATSQLADLCDKHPLRERLWGLSMLALYRDNRQAEALAAYQQLRTLLGEELGIEPSTKLQLLEERILLHDPRLELLAKIPHNLPAPLTSFVGRELELIEVGQLLTDARLVTLTGPGGSGKTRLGLEIARKMLDDYPDGVWLVELGHIADPDAVPKAIAETLGIQISAGTDLTEVLRNPLKLQTTLIVLDNYEHVIESAPVVSTLLEAAPNLRVLVTSRERLRLSGEHLYPVPPLEPADATSLFLQQARALCPGFALTSDNAGDVAAICEEVDRLPLAIELAAARVDVLPPAALRERLSSRLATLTEGVRDHPTRQHTLRHTIDWSYDLLEPEEQQLFLTLAVFNGGRSLEAVEAVCGPTLTLGVVDGLQSLMDKSLIGQRLGPDGSPRFFLLETVHEYARELLDAELDTNAIRQRHCDYFVQLAQRAGPARLYGAERSHWHRILHTDRENLYAAMAWAFTEGDPRKGCRLLGSVSLIWLNAEWRELPAWGREALRHVDALDPLTRACVYHGLGSASRGNQDFEEARRFFEDAVKWSRVAGDHHLIARAMCNLALTHMEGQGDYDRAVGQCRQALDEARTADEVLQVADAHAMMGELARMHDDNDTAAQEYEMALPIYREAGDNLHVAISLLNLAGTLENRGDHQAAQRLTTEGLTVGWELQHHKLIAWGLGAVAQVAIAAGQVERGARLLGATARAMAETGLTPDLADQPDDDRAWARLAQQLEPDELEALLAEGRAMSRLQAVTYALEEAPVGSPTADA